MKLLAVGSMILTLAGGAAADDFPVLRFAEQQVFAEVRDASDLQQRLVKSMLELQRMIEEPPQIEEEEEEPPADGDKRRPPSRDDRVRTLYHDIAATYNAYGAKFVAAYYFAALAARFPDEPHYQADVADMMLDMGERDRALALFNKAIALGGSDPYLFIRIGDLYFADGDFQRARDSYNRARELGGDSDRPAHSLLMLASIDALSGVDYRHALGRDAATLPNLDWPYPLIKVFLGTAEEVDLVAYFSADQEGRDHLCEALFYLGHLSLGRGDKDTARRYFRAVINTRLPDFRETGLARLALDRLREM